MNINDSKQIALQFTKENEQCKLQAVLMELEMEAL